MDEAISRSWKEAGSDLGIQVIAPFVVTIAGQEVAVEAFINHFGGPNGAIALSQSNSIYRKELSSLGYFVSVLFPPYRDYARQHFIDTLDDWQWFGNPEERPKWYTGKPWS